MSSFPPHRLKRTSPTAYCDCREKCKCRSLIAGNQAARFDLLNRLLTETSLVKQTNSRGENILLFLVQTVRNSSKRLSPYYTMRWVCVLVRFVSKNARKTRLTRVFTLCIMYSARKKKIIAFFLHFYFSCIFLVFCWYPKHEKNQNKAFKSTLVYSFG